MRIVDISDNIAPRFEILLSVEVEAFSVYCACADIEVVSVFLLWLRLS